jgi:hypothetical protein
LGLEEDEVKMSRRPEAEATLNAISEFVKENDAASMRDVKIDPERC